MRVLHLLAWLEAAGIEKWLLSMLGQIDRRDCAIDFCCKLREGSLAGEAKQQGAKVYTNLFTPSHVRYGRQLARILQEGKYDIVHNHMETLSGYPAWVARRMGVPVISSYHNTAFPPGEQSRNSRLLVGLRGSYAHVSIGYALRHSDFVTGCSRAVLESLTPDYARRPNFRVLYYGVPMPPLPDEAQRAAFRCELGWPEDLPLVLHVGRFEAQKNHEGLLEIFRRVRTCVPDAKLVLVGDGLLRSQTETRLKDWGITECVRLLGVRNDAPRIMNSLSDVFLFPSLHEGFGLVATEANGAGLPVVGSAISGLNEAVANGETALLHPHEDGEGMADSVVRLLTDPAYAHRIGEAGRKRVEADFSLSAAAKRLLELYDECLGHRQRAHDSHT